MMTSSERRRINSLRDAVVQMTETADSVGLPLAGVVQGVPDFEEVFALITATDGGSPAKHSWTEYTYSPGQQPEEADPARKGTPSEMPAYERNGFTVDASKFPFYAVLRRRLVSTGEAQYEFDAPLATLVNFTVRNNGNTVSTTVELITESDSALVQSGDAAILQDADATHAGLVSLSDQTMGDGEKRFQEHIVVDVGTAAGTGTDPRAILANWFLAMSPGGTGYDDCNSMSAYLFGNVWLFEFWHHSAGDLASHTSGFSVDPADNAFVIAPYATVSGPTRYAIGAGLGRVFGATGTDGVNTFNGGIVTTIGTALSVSALDQGAW